MGWGTRLVAAAGKAPAQPTSKCSVEGEGWTASGAGEVPVGAGGAGSGASKSRRETFGSGEVGLCSHTVLRRLYWDGSQSRKARQKLCQCKGKATIRRNGVGVARVLYTIRLTVTLVGYAGVIAILAQRAAVSLFQPFAKVALSITLCSRAWTNPHPLGKVFSE